MGLGFRRAAWEGLGVSGGMVLGRVWVSGARVWEGGLGGA